MKVSVVTIVYNNSSTIRDCIESVLAQNYPNIEHVVIDGGSTDGTLEILHSYKDRLGYLISEKDNGLYNALNKGIEAATGDIIGILHSDDLFYAPDTLEKVVAAFEESAADLVYANGLYVDKEKPEDVKRVYSSKPYKRRFLDFGWIPLHTTIYCKKEVFTNFGLYKENYAIASDYEISLRWFKESRIRKYFLNEWVVKMRLGGKSTTPALQKKKSTEDLEIIRDHSLPGAFTLGCKIGRKIPQYLLPKIKDFQN
ncbi:glycosyl transferase [Christiangramia fulva]|uniref:Glycosyl transferase n=1 Tax=Christiangramia fulva TaxID=2126553 RepID=A0A2R3Z4S9_9FLAO|nr:glycosyltransferase family 2 protein [Christiangramia fulva]AVR45283.1 glycosyl transferase [Christiangramia fulva]